jgi:hypothetical protein
MSKQVELKNALMETEFVRVEHETPDQFVYGAPHNFQFKNAGSGEFLGEIRFQKGPIKETGVNGVSNEVLLGIVVARLQAFQSGDFACRENALALTSIEEAMLWMKKRTLDRQLKGVEGTSKK